MLDRQTTRLAIQYAGLFLGSVAVLTFGILLYMNAASGGDYLNDMGMGGGPRPSDDQVQKATEAVQDRLERGLMLINGLLVLTIPVISYRMARAAIKPIQAGLEAQQRFVDNASHELGTPLSVISGELQLAVSKPRTATDYEAAIRASLEEVKNLASLTKNLALLARGQTEAVRAGFLLVDLDGVLHECVREAEPAATKRGVTLSYDSRQGSMVRGDMSLLRTLVFNLIDNAVKYSPDNAKVRAKLRREGALWLVSVQDRGPGMAKEELKLATRRFWRSKSVRASQGRGLGLAIAEEIAQLHQGRLTIKNGEKMGLVAEVRLPSANT